MKAEYVASLTGTFVALNERGLTYNWVNGQSSLVHHAREMAASAGLLNADETRPFHGESYRTMLWIDSDISWKPEDALCLIDSPHEVTTGVYLLADGVTSSVHPVGRPNEPFRADEIVNMTEPFQIQSCGFGFIAVKQGVFERMDRPWFAHFSQSLSNTLGKQMFDTIGEDISWCMRAYNAGIEIWFDPLVQVLHWKTVPVGFDGWRT